MATKAGVIWFVDKNEAVNRTAEIVCRDEIAMAITYEEAKEHDAIKDGRAIKKKTEGWPLWQDKGTSSIEVMRAILRALRKYMPEKKY